MTTRLQIKTAILIVLHRMDGTPLGELQLAAAVAHYFHGQEITTGDFGSAVAELQADAYLVGVTDEFTRRPHWSLLPKGQAKAATLR